MESNQKYNADHLPEFIRPRASNQIFYTAVCIHWNQVHIFMLNREK